MLRLSIAFLAVATLSACVDRTAQVTVPSALNVGSAETVYAATTRGRNPDGTFNADRGERVQYHKMTVSIPPNRTPGTLEFSYANPKPEKQFVLANTTDLSGPRELANQLRGEEDVSIFVHGYNSTHTETAFRAAQLAHDLDIPGSVLIYSWPSQARGAGYAYDLDSMLFARDGLEKTIRDLKSIGVKRVVLVAHSMGGALSMEMMRQAELRSPGWSRRNLDGVFLISPDLDIDVFRSQMDSIKTPPDPFVVMVSQKDKILNISARIRGTPGSERLGNISTIEALADYPIEVIDATAFNSDAESSHFVAATSPALLSLLSSARRVGNTLGNRRRGIDYLIPNNQRNPSGATEVVLSETGQAQVATQ